MFRSAGEKFCFASKVILSRPSNHIGQYKKHASHGTCASRKEKEHPKIIHDNHEDYKQLAAIITPALHNSSKRSKHVPNKKAFDNACLKGRFSYFNKEGNVASLSVGVFDGIKNITSFEDICANVPDGEGGRKTSTIPFNFGYYEVQASGRGKMFLSLGEEGGPYFDFPYYELEFVVTGTGENYEIEAMDSFQVAGVGLANQLVAPRWTKIAEE